MPLQYCWSDCSFINSNLLPSIESDKIIFNKVLNQLLCDEQLSSVLSEIGNKIAAKSIWWRQHSAHTVGYLCLWTCVEPCCGGIYRNGNFKSSTIIKLIVVWILFIYCTKRLFFSVWLHVPSNIFYCKQLGESGE